MVNTLIELLRLLCGKETREAIKSFSRSLAGLRKEEWKKEIRKTTGTFRGNELFKVTTFANHLLEDLASAGVSQRRIAKFKIVFGELVTNAFTHGCHNQPRGRVTVRCAYSRWFILLMVVDTGKGFDLNQILLGLPVESERDVQVPPHGLAIVQRLAGSLVRSTKGNAVTVTMGGQDLTSVLAAVKEYGDCRILWVTVSKERGPIWDWEVTDWASITDAIANAEEHLVLVDFQYGFWGSDLIRRFIAMFRMFSSQPSRFYALVTTRDTFLGNKLSKLASSNAKTFSDVEAARAWLLECGRHSSADKDS